MSEVYGRNRSETNKFKYASYFLCKLFSRLVLRKLNENQKKIFRELEVKSKTYIKTKADIEFLNYCKDNQLLPNFLKIRLYNNNLQDNVITKNFQLKLLDNEIPVSY